MGLMIKRREGEAVVIDNKTIITVSRIWGSTQVSLKIEAPKDVSIGRLETMTKEVEDGDNEAQ